MHNEKVEHVRQDTRGLVGEVDDAEIEEGGEDLGATSGDVVRGRGERRVMGKLSADNARKALENM